MQDRITEGPHTSVGLEQYMLIVVECHSDSFPSMCMLRPILLEKPLVEETAKTEGLMVI